MNADTKKELIHKYSNRIKEFYAGESTNADVDTCKLLADLMNEVEQQANEVNARTEQALPIQSVVCSTWIFFYEGEKDNPQFKVQANTQWEAYQVAEEAYGPQVEEMMYCMI